MLPMLRIGFVKGMAVLHSFLLTALLSLLLCPLVGCSMPKAPTLKPESTSVTGVSLQGISVRMTLAVYNPNDFDLKTQAVVGTINLDNKVTVGPVTVPHGVTLAAGKSTSVTFDMNPNWQQAIDLVKLSAGSGPTVPYQVDGKMTVGGEKLNVDVPFKISGQVSQADLVAASAKGLPSVPGLLKK